jgi:prephenate dehydratase
MRIAYQGMPGAFSELAAREHDPAARAVAMPDFDAVVRAVVRGTVEAGILPVENVVIGPIADSVNAMAATTRISVVDEVSVLIHHCLLALPGARLDSVRWVESHPAALAQCARWLSARRIPPRPVPDTAGAAHSIATDRDYTRAAIASAEAAEIYGLSILARDIADVPDNRTRFVIIRALRNEAAA